MGAFTSDSASDTDRTEARSAPTARGRSTAGRLTATGNWPRELAPQLQNGKKAVQRKSLHGLTLHSRTAIGTAGFEPATP